MVCNGFDGYCRAAAACVVRGAASGAVSRIPAPGRTEAASRPGAPGSDRPPVQRIQRKGTKSSLVPGAVRNDGAAARAMGGTVPPLGRKTCTGTACGGRKVVPLLASAPGGAPNGR